MSPHCNVRRPTWLCSHPCPCVACRWSTQKDTLQEALSLQSNVESFFKTNCKKFIYQLEDSGDDEKHHFHYQGYGSLLKRRRPCEIKTVAIQNNGLLNGVEIGVASTAGIDALNKYAMKSDTRVFGPWSDNKSYRGQDIITNLWPWQQEVKDLCSREPDNRTVNVVIDEKGNVGKSAFCKHMAWHSDALVLGWGKTGDLLNLVSKNQNKDVYIFDLSRSKPQDWAKDDIPAAMEGIKNGMFMNTKYETCQVLMKVPHVWVFTNARPNISSMSVDRWKLWSISESRLVPFGVRSGRRRSSCDSTLLVE